jgi:hypothetical protein
MAEQWQYPGRRVVKPVLQMLVPFRPADPPVMTGRFRLCTLVLFLILSMEMVSPPSLSTISGLGVGGGVSRRGTPLGEGVSGRGTPFGSGACAGTAAKGLADPGKAIRHAVRLSEAIS